jgi:hypothetical protein
MRLLRLALLPLAWENNRNDAHAGFASCARRGNRPVIGWACTGRETAAPPGCFARPDGDR